MVMDYYAYWNGGQIRDLFEALVSICSGSSYEGLLKTAVLAGFLVTLTGALLKWQGLASKVYLFAAVLFYSVMLVPKVDVAIHDERSADVYVVSNVPFGVGFFASATSKIGHFLTESFETAFSLPDAERFSKFGLVYPQRALNSLLAAGPVTPEGRALTDRVIADCIGPELLDHSDKAAELSHSGDIWATISADGWINPARSSVSSDGTVQRCDQALQNLEQHLNTVELDFLSKRLGTVLVPERIDPADVIRRTLPQSEALLLGVSRSLEQSLKHSVMLTALPRGMASIAAQAGAPLDLAAKYSASQANLTSEINYRTLARLAEHSLPKIRNCVEFIVIAAFPLMLLLMVAAGSAAGAVFRSFFVLLIWFQLWAPLLSVANYLMISVDANPMNRIATEFGGSTLLAAGIIREAGATSQAIAGSIMLLIPLIAFALAKGSDMAFVSMATGLMAPAQGASSGASAQAAAGNFNAGNISMGNTSMNSASANKSDLSSSWSDPYASKSQTAYGSVTRDETGTVTGMARTSIDLGVSSSGALTHSRTTGTASSSATTLTASESQALSLSSAATSSNAVSREFARAMSQGLSERLSAGQSTAGSSSSSYSKSTGESSTVSRGLSNSENLSFTSGAKLQAGGGEAQFSTDAAKEAAKDAKGVSSASSENLNLAAAQSSPAVLGAVSTQSKDSEGKPVARHVQNAMSHLRGAAEAAGMGIGLEAKTAQLLVDTATGSQSAATQRQKAEAYQVLKSTAKEIASSTTNDEMRRVAENFSAALDKAYRSSNDQSRMVSETFSASRSQSETLSGTSQTAVNNDILVMQKLLSSDNLSAESHLKALFDSSDKREYLGASVAADSYDRAADVRHLGPGQIQNTGLEQNALKRHGDNSLSAMQRKGGELIGKQAISLKDKTEGASLLSTSLNAGLKDFNRKFDEQEETNSVGLMNQDAMTELRRDRIDGASVNYLNEQKGMSTILLNSLAGGLGYREARVKKEAKDEN
ncbi:MULTISPECIES: conjugal transfer protein TraG N-terminal domain-containing protein [Parasutterella]|jgi:conjugal transfer mating pair stabilization protein TraG|uniref:conjugal transfer protein TraG N-terminal domain-containing protein n=3 Tax=Sutterellaceae TaxID=995019 RepID=UPI0022E8DBCF|nr:MULTISPECIES: conjugal transfer protein TraG N-terminal domain-containing protein [Parasutterella]MBS5225985.1 conjugal transfer protein TraG N-terminal domain-containing protein [Parasutterella sp.]